MSDTKVVERLAIELHRHYRAAEKALRCTDVAGERPYFQHDHGWSGCHRKPYFLQRAERVIRYSRIESADTLGDAERALDAHVLVRRSIVEGKPIVEGVDLKAKDFHFSDGGLIPAGKPYIVGERATDATDYLPIEARRLFGREEIARIFQVPLALLGWSVKTDAQLKAERDALIRKTLWGKPPKYTVTNAIAGPQTGRGVK